MDKGPLMNTPASLVAVTDIGPEANIACPSTTWRKDEDPGVFLIIIVNYFAEKILVGK